MFKSLRPLIRIAVALEQIANALIYFATADARQHNRLFVVKQRGWLKGKDESELLHTDDYENAIRREEEYLSFLQQGARAYKDEEQEG